MMGMKVCSENLDVTRKNADGEKVLEVYSVLGKFRCDQKKC